MSSVDEDPRVVAGMKAQLALRRSRLQSGEKSLGWKIAFAGADAMGRLGIQAPLVGFLTDRALVGSGSTVSIAGWTKAVVEPEVAVHMGRDLEGDADQETARLAIAAVGPAIELADLTFPAEEVEAILANDIYQRHVVLGDKEPARGGGNFDGMVGIVQRDGVPFAETQSPEGAPGDLIDKVRHVAKVLAAFGERLRAGEIIITGSIIPPIEVTERVRIDYELKPIGRCSVTFEP